MEKPKLNENYWYIEVNTDDTWAISKRVNKMTDIDKYNFACENFYLSEDEAAASASCISGSRNCRAESLNCTLIL